MVVSHCLHVGTVHKNAPVANLCELMRVRDPLRDVLKVVHDIGTPVLDAVSVDLHGKCRATLMGAQTHMLYQHHTDF